MWLKFILRLESRGIGLKFNPNTNKIVLGGYSKDFEIFETIRTEFINTLQFKVTFPNHNKMRIQATCNYKQFVQMRSWLREENYLLQKVKNHGRLFR